MLNNWECTMEVPRISKLNDVLYVEGLMHDLLMSISQLCDLGHQVSFSQDHCVIKDKDNGEVLTKGFQTNDNCYIVEAGHYNTYLIGHKDESYL